MLLTIMTYHYCSGIRVLSSLHVYGFTATCFHVWLTLRMLSIVVDLVLVGSSNVSCAIVIYLSYCYGDQLSFTAFACLLRDSRHHSGDEGGISSESISLEAVLTDLSWQALSAGGWKPSTQTWSRSRYIWSAWNYILARTK